MASMATTTISISHHARKELLKVAAHLQAKRGERVDYDQVIRYLLSRSVRDESALLEACKPSKVRSAEIREELRRGRREDRRAEEDLERRYA